MRIVHKKSQSLFWLLFFVLSLLPMGCGPKRPPTVLVQGKVTWQGRALTDGMVTFDPIKIAEGLPKRPAVAELGPDGVYHASTFRSGDGLVPGEYGVMVHSYTSRPTPQDENRPFIWRIPSRFGDTAKSGLSFTVPADARGPLTFDIDVTR